MTTLFLWKYPHHQKHFIAQLRVFDPIYSLFSQKFFSKTLKFPETLGTISRSAPSGHFGFCRRYHVAGGEIGNRNINSAQAGLLKNLQNPFSTPLGSQEISKNKLHIFLKHPDMEKVASMQAFHADKFWENCGHIWVNNEFLAAFTYQCSQVYIVLSKIDIFCWKIPNVL